MYWGHPKSMNSLILFENLDQCQFYHDQHGKSNDLGPISLVIEK